VFRLSSLKICSFFKKNLFFFLFLLTLKLHQITTELKLSIHRFDL
jgi:hypothetical protein